MYANRTVMSRLVHNNSFLEDYICHTGQDLVESHVKITFPYWYSIRSKTKMGRRSGMQVNCYLGWGETAMRSTYPSENHLVQTSPRQNLSSHYSQAHYPLTSPKCSLPRQSRQFYLALVLSHAIVLQTASSFAATGRSSELGNSSQKNLQPVPKNK